MARWQDYVLRGTRAAQPNSVTTTIGTLYCVTDESDIVERWSGTAWEAYSVSTASFGDVTGPGSSTDNDIALFNGATGKIIKDSGSTIASVEAAAVAAAIAAIIPVDLASEVTNDLPFANLTPATAGSKLLGRGSSGAGDFQEITLGSGLSMSGTTLSASGSGATVDNSVNSFRLTLATGRPRYMPLPATPSSTDTTNDIVTFSVDPDWYNGTILTPVTTGGGLTAGTRYYIHRITATTYSFHTTVADAMSGANRVNLTASITSSLNTSGISATGVYLTPFKGDTIALYTGYAWVITALSEMSVGLGTLSSGKNYDVFLDYNGGSPVLSLGTAWTSDTVRAVDITRQDGVWVSSADAQSRYVGTIRTDSTTTTIDDGGGIISQSGGKRFVFNADNGNKTPFRVKDTTATWTWATGNWELIHGVTAPTNCCEIVVGLNGVTVEATYLAGVNVQSNSTRNAAVSIGIDSSNPSPYSHGGQGFNQGTLLLMLDSLSARFEYQVGIGYHYIAPLEFGADGTSNFRGSAADGSNVNGMSGSFLA